MAKNLPPCPKAPSWQFENALKIKYLVHIVTPLVGGGVEAGKNDPITLIRGASIRGQLRFWWRASRGGEFSENKALYQKEGEIWGTSESPSSVSIEVKDVQPGTQEPCAEFVPDTQRGGVKSFPKFNQVPGYVMFPFQGKVERGEVKQQPAKITRTASFTLEIAVAETYQLDVEAAVWAWVNFGGLGARTRRGCGTLLCEELAPNQDNIHAWYEEHLHKYGIVSPKTIPDWPILPDRLLLQNRPATPAITWETVANLLKTFRQGENFGRNPGRQTNRPGRSHWPEADSLRRITQTSCSQHAQSITTAENAFPRAELGLPIVFHFKDGRDGDPQDSELYPKGLQRMASPLILKPLALQSLRAVPMIMCLQTKPPMKVELKKVPHPPTLGQRHIRRPELATYDHSPMAGLSSQGSALEAFLNFARNNGFC